MIEAKELRIGNLVFDDNNKPCRISFLSSKKRLVYEGMDSDEYQIEYEDKPYIYISKTINPIPLTGEWLIKLGFTKGENAGTFTKLLPYDLVYLYIDLYEGCYTTVDGKDYKTPPYVALCRGEDGYKMHNGEHVHQLQNLYFALTGEELELKEGDK